MKRKFKELLTGLLATSGLAVLCFCNTACTKQNQVDFTRISIDPENAGTLKYSEIYSKIEILPIETDTAFLIDEVQKLIVENDKYFFQCNNKILVFNSTGRPLYKIDNVGKGPGEYIAIGDIILDEGRLELYDSKQRKIIQHDENGRYLNEWRCGIDAYSFVKLNSDLYAFYVGAGGYYNNTNKKLLVFSRKKGKVIDGFIETPEYEMEYMHFADLVNFQQYKEDIYFLYSFNDTIYNITGNGISPRYFIDFGKYRLPHRYLEGKYNGIEAFFSDCLKSGSAFKLMGFFESDEYIISSFFYNGFNYIHFYYSKSKREARVVDAYFDDMLVKGVEFKTSFYNLPFTVKNNKTYTVTNAYELMAKIDSLRSKVTVRDWEIFLEKNADIMELYNKISIDSNPVLLIGSLV
ncbi:MAG: 6-bladed beta-propeller [Bacteroidales bacterium]